MQTPIEWNPPWRTKYIDEETYLLNQWFIFGQYEDGTVCITDGTNDIFTRIPRDTAEEICRLRQEFCSKLVGIMNLGTNHDYRFDYQTGLPKAMPRPRLFRERIRETDPLYTVLTDKFRPVEEVRIALGMSHDAVLTEILDGHAAGLVECAREDNIPSGKLLVRKRK